MVNNYYFLPYLQHGPCSDPQIPVLWASAASQHNHGIHPNSHIKLQEGSYNILQWMARCKIKESISSTMFPPTSNLFRVWNRLGHTSFTETQYCGTRTENMNAGRVETHLLVWNLKNWDTWDLLEPETKNLLITKLHKLLKFWSPEFSACGCM